MPDPTASPELLESYALAPSDEIILSTLEFRHPSFIDASGNPDSAWMVADTRDFVGTIESGAPIRPGEAVTFIALPFQFHLPPIQPGSMPEIEISVDNVSRILTEQFDLAVQDARPIVACYRPYLASDPSTSQMLPPPVFTLSDVHIGVLRVTARARTAVDTRAAFPRRLYTAQGFPGLVNS